MSKYQIESRNEHRCPDNTIPCPNCEGEGKLNVSNCCGALPVGNGDCDSSDFGLCPDCLDHCTYDMDCDHCNGTGEIIN